MRGATSSPCPHQRARPDFNPHSPCGERPHNCRIHPIESAFQSTLPMRGATLSVDSRRPDTGDFNPHSPCGERLSAARTAASALSNFNPHSPCGERLAVPQTVRRHHDRFQSTLPMRGATHLRKFISDTRKISIHTPHAGSDHDSPDTASDHDISIHTPHAGSDIVALRQRGVYVQISIHTPHAGSDN